MAEKTFEPLAAVFSGITTILASAGYAETFDIIYLILTIVGAAMSLISIGITLYCKIKAAVKDGKVTDEELKSIQESVEELRDGIENVKNEISAESGEGEENGD